METPDSKPATTCVKRSHIRIRDFYHDWFRTLKISLLPLLQSSISTVSENFLTPVMLFQEPLRSATATCTRLLLSHIRILRDHFLSYFTALDHAAHHDVTQLLFPNWRNPLEKPFLWLGDLHPKLFIHLIRFFISNPYNNKPVPFAFAWKDVPERLVSEIEQIDRGLGLMVPAITVRFRDLQEKFVESVGMAWVQGRKLEGINEAAVETEDELVSVFLDANRLRGSILTDIVGAMDAYQAALYLEALANFVIGFQDGELLQDLKHCELPFSSDA